MRDDTVRNMLEHIEMAEWKLTTNIYILALKMENPTQM